MLLGNFLLGGRTPCGKGVDPFRYHCKTKHKYVAQNFSLYANSTFGKSLFNSNYFHNFEWNFFFWFRPFLAYAYSEGSLLFRLFPLCVLLWVLPAYVWTNLTCLMPAKARRGCGNTWNWTYRHSWAAVMAVEPLTPGRASLLLTTELCCQAPASSILSTTECC